jgi:aspartyl/asparaginyl beta-hydroxylase (cupin superfamily)
MQAGRMDEAARLWAQVLELEPEHPQALFYLAQYRLMQKDVAGAILLLDRAAKGDPSAPAIPLNLSFVHRARDDSPAELAALDRALALDPYYLPALLAKGAALERIGRFRQAARSYKNALAIAPPPEQLAPELQKHLAAARGAVARNAEELDRHLQPVLEDVHARWREAGGRFGACKEALLGRQKIYTQQPTLLHFPELPAIQFYRNEDFSWLAELEARTAEIRDELLRITGSEKDFQPYVQFSAGVPVNQWTDLNHSPRWSAYFLWEDGKRQEAHSAECPRTAAIVERMPLAKIPGYAPAVFFSVLEPHTRIPPHTGATNIRLIVHLPLIVPEGCYFRVGNDTREVVPGKAWVFDDTIEHEAWNDSDSPRVVLIFDIWNPLLTPMERELASALLAGLDSYYAAG